MPIVRLPNLWQPRSYQRPLWSYLERGGKRAVEIAHRRWGKDDVSMHWSAVAAHQKVATYWHMLPEYSQGRKAIWNAINPKTGKRRIDEAFPHELRANTNEQEMFIRFKIGSSWQVVGSDMYNSLVGAPPAGVVMSEYALANPAAWAYISPILEENNGWAAFITTTRGRNHAYDMLKTAQADNSWFAEISDARVTGIFSDEQLDKIQKELISQFGGDLGDAYFRQEYLCSFDAAIMGAVYGKWIEDAEKSGRITDKVKHDPGFPVYTAWDLGWTDATTIIFYQLGYGEIMVIDSYENSGHDIGHYCDVVKAKPYKYHTHFAPHDANNKLQAAGGRSIAEQAHKDHGIKFMVVPATSDANAIAATRKTLPRCWIAATPNTKLVTALQSYHFPYDEELKVFRTKPRHDWSSHFCKAFEILARMWHEQPMTAKELHRQEVNTKFHRLRSEHNVGQNEDPYRTRKKKLWD